ncbi:MULTISPECIES: anti-anti-sigma factor [Streptomyces]|uniref:anti-anti-sigma factor n=1 Tax=Streptomyces TaxID=1883 RepID=UPI000564218E|nr:MULTISPECIES: anti-anti-sigma factor [Streptomyces]
MTSPHPGHAAAAPVPARGERPLVTLRGEPHGGTAERLRQDVTHRIARGGATGAVIGLSGVDGVDGVDSFPGRVLAEIAADTRPPAAHTAVAGMRPAVAITPVGQGPTLPGAATALGAEQGTEPLTRSLPAAADGRGRGT